jgi:hypothetical protein
LSDNTLVVKETVVETLTDLSTQTVHTVETRVEALTAVEQGPAGAQGQKGDTGQGFTVRGVWDAGVLYSPYDVVAYQGASYVALAPSLGAQPGSNNSAWQLMARSGDGDKSYTHQQLSASSAWTVTHNLGKYPAVEVIDSGDNVVEGDVTYLDLNTLTITFSAPFGGVASCN